MHTDYILCCDWGTSSFRLRLINLKGILLAECFTDQGIFKTYQDWEKQSANSIDGKFNFYLKYIKSQIASLHCNDAINLYSLPIVISGMATSTIGMQNVPYAQLPFLLNGSVGYEVIKQKHEPLIILATGVCSDNDMMRGEETQLMGLFHLEALQNILPKEGVFILPGTHSKHITVENKAAISIKTYMTGELFQILTENGTLSKSVQPSSSSSIHEALHTEALIKGVQESKNNNVLNSLFKVRVNDVLFNKSHLENFYFLSGVLIGTELNYLITASPTIVICGSDHLLPYYKIALAELGLSSKCIFIDPALLDHATMRGQLAIFNNYTQNSYLK